MGAIPSRLAAIEGVALNEQAPGITRSPRAEAAPPEAGSQLRRLLEKLPAAAYTCDAQGLITYYNPQAAQLWGRAPKLNDPSERYCGSLRLFSAEDGAPVAHERCWMALALEEGREYERREIVVERPDGRRLTALAHANPIHDEESGRLLGGMNVLVDVTDHRRTEEERDRIFALSPDLLCVAGLDGYFKRMNPAFEETLGYTVEELLAKPFIEFVHPDDRAATLGELEKLGTGATTLHFENRYLRKDGSWVWLAWKAVPVVEDGLVYAAARDVTEQKRVEEELKESEERFRNMADNAPVMIWVCEPDGYCTYLNKPWYDFTGQRPGSGLGHRWLVAVHPEDRSRYLDAFAEANARREAFSLDYRLRRNDGGYRWVIDAAAPRFGSDGEFMGYVGSVIDITGRKRTEQALRESEGHLRFVLKAGGLGSWKLDLTTGEMESSGTCKTNLGLPPDADLSYDALLSMIHPDDRDSMREAVETAIAAGSDYEADYRITTPGGEVRWIAARGRVVYAPDEAPRELAGITLDITKRKRAEAEARTRADQQAAVAELGQRALSQTDLSALMDDAVSMVARVLETEYCKVLELLPEGDALLLRAGVGWKEGLVGEATVGAGLDSQAGYTLLSDEPVTVEDLHEEGRFGGSPLLREHGVVSGISVVIRTEEGPFGVLGAHTAGRRRFTEDDANFILAVANVLGTAVGRSRAEEQMREIKEAERHRIARDMHDEALQDLTYALAETQLVQVLSEDPSLRDRLGRVAEALVRAGRGLRTAIFDLRLGENGGRSFAAQLESLVELNRRYSPGCEVELVVDVAPPLAGANGIEVLHIVQEALANVRRHSGAGRARVAVGVEGGKLRVEVCDDGRGFDRAAPTGLGITGMRERARALGGDLRITSRPGGGTEVRLVAPLQSAAEASEGDARVLLVEDHASLREAVAGVLEREPGFAVAGQAGSLAEAREQRLDDVDVAIVDLGLPDGYGGDLIADLREANPQAQALVLSASLDRAQVARAVEAGAAGVLHKSAGIGELLDAVRRLRAGETLLPLEEVVELLRFASARKDEEYEARRAKASLTEREKEVLQALAEGLDGEHIAERLHISIKTERNHMASILAKLGVHSRLQALVFALRYGIAEVRRAPGPGG